MSGTKDKGKNPDRKNGKAWKKGLPPEVRAKQDQERREAQAAKVRPELRERRRAREAKRVRQAAIRGLAEADRVDQDIRRGSA